MRVGTKIASMTRPTAVSGGLACHRVRRVRIVCSSSLNVVDVNIRYHHMLTLSTPRGIVDAIQNR
jgi:hypothetical protein